MRESSSRSTNSYGLRLTRIKSHAQHAHQDSIIEIYLFTEETMETLSRGESIAAYNVASSEYSTSAFSKLCYISAVYKIRNRGTRKLPRGTPDNTCRKELKKHRHKCVIVD